MFNFGIMIVTTKVADQEKIKQNRVHICDPPTWSISGSCGNAHGTNKCQFTAFFMLHVY